MRIVVKFKEGTEYSDDVKKYLLDPVNIPLILLEDNNWDDWFEFEPLYDVIYLKNDKRIRLGRVKRL